VRGGEGRSRPCAFAPLTGKIS